MRKFFTTTLTNNNRKNANATTTTYLLHHHHQLRNVTLCAADRRWRLPVDGRPFPPHHPGVVVLSFPTRRFYSSSSSSAATATTSTTPTAATSSATSTSGGSSSGSSSDQNAQQQQQQQQQETKVSEIVRSVIAVHSPTRYVLSDVATAATLLPLQNFQQQNQNQQSKQAFVMDSNQTSMTSSSFSHIGIEMQYPPPAQRRSKTLSATVGVPGAGPISMTGGAGLGGLAGGGGGGSTKPTEVLILKMLVSRPDFTNVQQQQQQQQQQHVQGSRLDTAASFGSGGGGGVDRMKQEEARVAFLVGGHVIAFGLTEDEFYAFRKQAWLQDCQDHHSSVIQAAAESADRGGVGRKSAKKSAFSNASISSSGSGSAATSSVGATASATAAGGVSGVGGGGSGGGSTASDFSALAGTAANATYDETTGDTLIHMRYTTVAAIRSLNYDLPAGVDAPYIDEGPLSAIVLKDESPLNKLPFMYCLSAVATIEALERRLVRPAHSIRQWRDHMRTTGKLNFTTNEARRTQSVLHTLQLQQARVGQRPALFAQPDYGQLKEVYNQAYEYYEIDQRAEAIGDSIETVQNSLTYLVSESHAKVNHDLEVVIVVLIAVEIFIHLFLPAH